MNPFPDTITDIHTHNRQCGDWAILSVNAGDPLPPAPAFLSSGLHPWHTVDPDAEERMAALENTAVSTRITAIGECGLDRLRGADIKRQEQLFAHHILLSEQLRKPMIIHCVRIRPASAHAPRIPAAPAMDSTRIPRQTATGITTDRQWYCHIPWRAFQPPDSQYNTRRPSILRDRRITTANTGHKI